MPPHSDTHNIQGYSIKFLILFHTLMTQPYPLQYTIILIAQMPLQTNQVQTTMTHELNKIYDWLGTREYTLD